MLAMHTGRIACLIFIGPVKSGFNLEIFAGNGFDGYGLAKMAYAGLF